MIEPGRCNLIAQAHDTKSPNPLQPFDLISPSNLASGGQALAASGAAGHDARSHVNSTQSTTAPGATPAAPPPVIRVVGAREHNLADISVDIPRGRLTVITGVSGSGKSTLAFDTIYAEGQRRYVEALSTHSRQFLEQLHKPDVDRIDGLPPTLAVEQRLVASGPRSTVATVTEIHDFLRVLYARVGSPHCWICRRPIRRWSVAGVVDATRAKAAGGRVLILAPILRDQPGDPADRLAAVLKQGFVRVRVDGSISLIEELPPLDPDRTHSVDVVVDRLALRDDAGPRLAESIESASRLAGGRVLVVFERDSGSSEEEWFSTRYACPLHDGVALDDLSPRMFSFNSPHGACSTCTGLGTVFEFDAELVVPDADVSLAKGAIAPWRRGARSKRGEVERLLADLCSRLHVEPEAPFRNLREDARRIILEGTTDADARRLDTTFEGVLPSLKRQWDSAESPAARQKLNVYRSERTCLACLGRRLGLPALSVLVSGRNIADVCSLTLVEALKCFEGVRIEGEWSAVADPLLREIRHRLRFLVEVGVEYLSLDRPSETLSGGEAQRIRLATHIGSGLVGVCYVLDEPTVGLHPRDTARLVKTFDQLRRQDNTVIVVEHDEDVIAAADHVIDIGPGPGEHGGRLVAAGPVEVIRGNRESLTGRYLSGDLAIPVPASRRAVDPMRMLTIRGARANNLKGITARIPLGCLVCVTGVSGSGKSTLVNHVLLKALRRRLDATGPRPGAFGELLGAELIDTVIRIDQTPLGRSARSNPATYVGVFDDIRELFSQTREAKVRGYGTGRFSFNTQGGRCEACTGQGTKRIEMQFLPDVFITCESCGGRRFNRETLEVRYRGRSIADVLDMRVEEGLAFFSNFTRIRRLLGTLKAVGMGYVSLGQACDTLSGGEAQRLKLAAELGKPATEHTLYVLDEPTRGLHAADVHTLLGVFSQLLSKGNTVLVIEHHLDLIKSADWVIDLGPEGGDGGGEIVAEGTPEQVAACATSHTGRYLKTRLAHRMRVH
ncbi:MAG: excinuclease ABC subunit UvrA [Phycisphaerales bacterium]|nr:excinuclease ABC subunit UvrA [Phycisphaerales bacterium]